MYKSFRIKNFRCFKDFSIDHLERVNLISGANNVGKTALLEAIFLHAGGTNIELTVRLKDYRGQGPFLWTENIWGSLFHQYDDKAKIEIEAKDSGEQVLRLTLRLIEPDSTPIQQNQDTVKEIRIRSTESVQHGLELAQELDSQRKVFKAFVKEDRIEYARPEPPSFPCYFSVARIRPDTSQIAERYGDLETENQEQTVLDFLKIVEPRLKRLAVVVTGGSPVLHGDIGLERLIPLVVMGDGMGRLASLAIAIANARSGVVLIDEIEDSIHHSIMVDLWLGIARLARFFDVQIFATTHSFEFISVAHRAFQKSGEYDFRFHRLDRSNDKIKAHTFDEEMLESVLRTRWEIR